jgi:cob(I)alamin adenosyltransferase
MVVLSRIYTKTGDGGTTALGDGRRVRKDHPRIAAYGTVDELNAALGLATGAGLDQRVVDLLHGVQNDLFDLGADLCVPETAPRGRARRKGAAPLRMTAAQTTRLERAIDRYNADLAPLRSFVLPGGTAAAWLHLARTICRRAERQCVSLARREKLNRHALIYLNRLSDLLFVLARHAGDRGRTERLWVPGGRGSSTP